MPPKWAEAMTNAINYDLAVVKSGKSIVDGIGPELPKTLEPTLKKSMLDTCNKNYGDMIENLKQRLGYVSKDPNDFLVTCGRVLSIVADYTDGISEFAPVPANVAKYANEIKKNVSVLDAHVSSKPNLERQR